MSGHLWIAEASGYRIRVVTPDESVPGTVAGSIAQGSISTAAGVGFAAFSGDGGPAVEAHISAPSAVVLDVGGNVYVADSLNGRVRKIDPSGHILTVAGGGTAAPGTEGVAATEVQLQPLGGLIVTEDSTLIFTESVGRIRSVTQDGMIRTVGGGGALGLEGDGGPARNARLLQPWSLARDGSGNLFVAEEGRYCIRKISPEGIISTVAGTGVFGDEGDGGPAVKAQLRQPRSIVFDRTGQLFVLSSGRVRVISTDGMIRTHLDASAALSGMSTLTFDGNGTLWAGGSSTVGQVLSGGIVQVIGGTTPCRDESSARECLVNPLSLTADSDGLIYFGEGGLNPRILAIDREGVLRVLYENTGAASREDGVPLAAASISFPRSILSDTKDDLWIGDEGYMRVRKVTRFDGVIRTVAGNGTRGMNGDGGSAVEAQISAVSAITVDKSGSLFLVNFPKVRKVEKDGLIQTFAGNGQRGFAGDGGPAIEASMEPSAIASALDGSLLIAEVQNRRIRLVTPDGLIRTVAGGGSSTGDGPATERAISGPLGVAALAEGGFVFSTTSAIYAVSPTGWLERIAGGDLPGHSGDDGPALEARMNPSQLCVEANGAILFLDGGNQRIRRLMPVREKAVEKE